MKRGKKMEEVMDELQELREEQELETINLKALALRLLWYVAVALLVVIFVVKLAQHTYSLCYIPSNSMEPTMMEKDVMLVSHYDIDTIERYDILVFNAPDDPALLYTKRVIGLPGDIVVVKKGKVTVNGEKIDDSFANEMRSTAGDGTYCVPDDCYFMLGDNRDDSLDSRFWENTYLPKENIQGKVKTCLFPLNRIHNVNY